MGLSDEFLPPPYRARHEDRCCLFCQVDFFVVIRATLITSARTRSALMVTASMD
jgi:hypothetical protein